MDIRIGGIRITGLPPVILKTRNEQAGEAGATTSPAFNII